VKMVGFSVFDCFWPKIDAVDRVSKPVVIVDGTVEPKEVVDGVDEEKPAKFSIFLLAERIFGFFFDFRRALGTVM
jgi:hypothetical protein